LAASTTLITADNSSIFASQAGDIPLQSQQDPLFMFTAATFQAYVNSYFQTYNPRGQAIALQLLKVDQFQERNTVTLNAVPTDSFSLLFISNKRLPTSTTIYKIDHPALGQFNLFLTPSLGNRGELYYQAVFNHLG
jgi:hypothetical protein